MNVILLIPDDFAARFGSGADLGRRAFEALALEEYRAGRITRPEMQRLLGFPDEAGLANFLATHGIGSPVAVEARTQSEGREIVEKFIAFRAGKRLDRLNVINLIREGRR